MWEAEELGYIIGLLQPPVEKNAEMQKAMEQMVENGDVKVVVIKLGGTRERRTHD